MGLRVLYLAKHESGGNDDEGAITFALEALGHRVERLREKRAYIAHRMHAVDLVLFHHCQDYSALAACKPPKVCWVFDLISYPDPLLERRNQQRRAWMAAVTRVADLVFATDGDFVAQDRTGKLVWLPQGADERVVGAGNAADADTLGRDVVPLLFTGISRGGGRQRVEFVTEMTERYGDDFRHIQRGVYGRALADLIAASRIVLAPSGPVSHRYWSNRVYNVLGFGGFLLHPYSEGLAKQYEIRREIAFYYEIMDLRESIAYYQQYPEDAARIAAAGLERTRREHLYRHRLAAMLETVKERLHIG